MLSKRAATAACIFRSHAGGRSLLCALQHRCFAAHHTKHSVAPLLHNEVQKRFKAGGGGAKRTLSARQRATQNADIERAREQDELLHGKAPSMETGQLETEFNIDKYTEEQVESFFSTETLDIDQRVNTLLERNEREGDVFNSLQPARRINKVSSPEGDDGEPVNSPMAQYSAKEMFEIQMNYDENLEEMERAEETRSFMAGDRKLYNEPVFASVPMRPAPNKFDDSYARYLKGNNSKPYEEYAYYNKGLFNTRDDSKKFQSFNLPPDSPIDGQPFDKEDQIRMYQEAQSHVIQKFVDKPNQNFEHLYAMDAPQSITKEDFAKIYLISNEDYKKYFSGGLGGDLDQVFDTLCQRALMIRPPVMPVFQQLTKMKQAVTGSKLEPHENKRGFVFTGSRGSGKSCLLATVAHSAFRQGMVVFYIPSLRQWTHGIHYAEPSPLLKGFFDLPTPEKAFLKQFQQVNSDLLKQMMLSKKYDLPLEAGQKQPITLYDLITYGISLETNIPVVFKLLLDELLANDTVPTLFALDDYNLLSDTTGFSYGNLDQMNTTKLRPIHGSELTLTHGIERIIQSNKPNHLVVGANSMKYPTNKKYTFKEEVLDIVHVPRYTYLELRNMCEYYMSAYWVFAKPEEYIQDLIFMSGGNPGLVWQEMSLV